MKKIIKGYIQSVIPATIDYGFTYFADMIPPFKPRNVLILGYGLGTIAGLIKTIWGNIPITGIDIEIDRVIEPDIFIHGDAQTFIKTLPGPYDYIIVDLFDGGSIPSFVFQKEFIEDIKLLNPHLVALNTFYPPENENMNVWDIAFYTMFWKTNSKGNTIHFFSPNGFLKQGLSP